VDAFACGSRSTSKVRNRLADAALLVGYGKNSGKLTAGALTRVFALGCRASRLSGWLAGVWLSLTAVVAGVGRCRLRHFVLHDVPMLVTPLGSTSDNLPKNLTDPTSIRQEVCSSPVFRSFAMFHVKQLESNSSFANLERPGVSRETATNVAGPCSSGGGVSAPVDAVW